MGCCESAPEDDIPLSSITNPYHSSLTSMSVTETRLMQHILTSIPAHCRQPIMNLSPRVFLSAYHHYLVAADHYKREEFRSGLISVAQAIRSFQILLPQHKDHFIFAAMFDILFLCLLSVGDLPEAIKSCKTALFILLTHTPTDYKAIHEHYSQLALSYKLNKSWQASIGCSTKAIEIARLIREPDEDRIRLYEAIREDTRRQAILNEPIFTMREIKPNAGESNDECRHRAVAETHAFNAMHGTLAYDISEITRIPDKQTELQVTEEILNEVLNNLVQNIRSQCAALNNASRCSWSEDLVVNFKLANMKTSPLSPTIIEAALTMIIDRLNSEDMPNDERYMELKQAPVQVSYTDKSVLFKKGVRVLVYRSKKVPTTSG